MSGSLRPAEPAPADSPAVTPPAGPPTIQERRKRGKDRKEFLDQASDLLGGGVTDRGLLSRVVRHCVPAIADCASIDLMEEGSIRRVEVAHVTPAMESLVREMWEQYPFAPDDEGGVPEVVRTGRPQYFQTIPDEVTRAYARDERHAEYLARYGATSYVCVPLSAGGNVFGALSLVFTAPESGGTGRRYTESDLDLASALAVRIGGAIAFARLLDIERRARERAAFLSEAGEVLGSSLDYQETLQSLARLAIPRLADWCVVDMIDDPDAAAWPPRLRRVALEHPDPERVALARRLADRYPPDWSRETGLVRTLRDGTPEFIQQIPPAALRDYARDAEHLALLEELQFGGAMVVPLAARGQVLGAITMIRSHISPRYTEADLDLAMEVARRASAAVENARLYRQAQVANTAKMRFLATMSHELRTPLNAIAGYVELLEIGVRGELNAEQRADLARIRRSQQSLLALIDDVLTFAKLESGKMEFHVSETRLQPLITALAQSAESLMRRRDVVFEAEPVDPNLTAWADPVRLEQVLLNLLSNAVKFTERGRVSVWCEADDQVVQIHVSDTGIGIPESRLRDIFEPFVQIDGAFTRRREGTGLGLAISREFARAMAGDVLADSTPGEGTTMTVRLRRTAP